MINTCRTFCIAALFPFALFSQQKKPVLVVGIVVDQMRNEYISRYWDRFGTDGFRSLITRGYYCRNTHYNYIPTYTAPGHASIYTGSTPRKHGIVGNDWYDKRTGKKVSCVEDTSVAVINGKSGEKGLSPVRELCNTIGDELRLADPQSKVFSFAIKDRSAILPAGHAANGAFWMDQTGGGFTSSTWYMKELPAWLKSFNDLKMPAKLLADGWKTLYPLNSYTASVADENNYENAATKNMKPVFPYDYSEFLSKGEYRIVAQTPFGNTFTTEAAKACVLGEKLGKDAHTDLLCISYSSTDMIAHSYGPRAVEVEDVYLRLDQEIAQLLKFLQKETGGNFVVFLTGDHGGGEAINHMRDVKIPAGNMYETTIKKLLRNRFNTLYNDSMLVLSVSNEQVFLDEKKCMDRKLSLQAIEQEVCTWLLEVEGVAEAYRSELLRNGSFPERDVRTFLQNGFNHRQSGNVAFVYKPGWHDHGPKGTTHGSAYNYDTHVPLIFYGAGIRNGESLEHVTITQIAPTIAELLRISYPGCTVGSPLGEMFSKWPARAGQ